MGVSSVGPTSGQLRESNCPRPRRKRTSQQRLFARRGRVMSSFDACVTMVGTRGAGRNGNWQRVPETSHVCSRRGGFPRTLAARHQPPGGCKRPWTLFPGHFVTRLSRVGPRPRVAVHGFRVPELLPPFSSSRPLLVNNGGRQLRAARATTSEEGVVLFT